ncbi:hypothetical protein EDD30_6703 [Couchioplanes caeruleus]|uniref:Uncharacterized protein n=2 Tax=Couchioplanes caeruleus TaxID=56438 RepID=A0A1K0FE08_9ACTN|nr:hypothetical protein BG844_28315 [Couchioplanes caeruleus subsp. caeruleus]ROP33676.1 hypothetical protein EDD30_6703 [Couchioplanes caeruleus]
MKAQAWPPRQWCLADALANLNPELLVEPILGVVVRWKLPHEEHVSEGRPWADGTVRRAVIRC